MLFEQRTELGQKVWTLFSYGPTRVGTHKLNSPWGKAMCAR
jgi:hypothetical protein